jgi:hypothetical protein
MNRTAFEMTGGLKTGPPCPYCGESAILVDSSIVYGQSYGLIWICPSYPDCDAYVGVHKSGEYMNYPLGSLADKELRELRKKAHSVFDTIWKTSRLERGQAYRWMQEIMKIDHVLDCHIAEMNPKQCQELYEHCVNYLQTKEVTRGRYDKDPFE